MEAQEIIESNKLIAEFMVGKPIIQNSGVYVNRKVFIVSGRDYLTDRLEYHSSYDWLMPVVNKCFDNTTEDERQFKGLVLFEIGLFTPIEEIWYAVVEFIKWHNKQNKK